MTDKTNLNLTEINIADIKSVKEVTSIFDASEGDVLPNGTVVERFLSKSNQHAIYKTVGELSFTYTYKTQDVKIKDEIRKFDCVFNRYRDKRRGVIDEHFERSAISTLRAIFQNSSPDAIRESISDLEKQIEMLESIETVIARGKGYQVWIACNGETQYIHSNSLPDVAHSISAYTKIKAHAAAFLPKSQRNNFNRRLGAALAEAFQTKPGKDIDSIFIPLEEYIQQCISNNARIDFLAVTSLATMILICLSYILYQILALPSFLHTALIAVSGGYLGTFISVFERSKSMSVGANDSTNLILFQGTLRVILGGVFGLIAYAAALSGMAFTIFSHSTASLILLGVAAGFSERLIPDLIHGFSPNQNIGKS